MICLLIYQILSESIAIGMWVHSFIFIATTIACVLIKHGPKLKDPQNAEKLSLRRKIDKVLRLIHFNSDTVAVEDGHVFIDRFQLFRINQHTYGVEDLCFCFIPVAPVEKRLFQFKQKNHRPLRGGEAFFVFFRLVLLFQPDQTCAGFFDCLVKVCTPSTARTTAKTISRMPMTACAQGPQSAPPAA